MLAVPGKGYVFIRAFGRYLTADQMDWQGDVHKPDPGMFTSSSPVDLALNWNAIGMVTVLADKPTKQYAFHVDPGETLKARITDTEGKPLVGALVSDRNLGQPNSPEPLKGYDFEIGQVNPKWPARGD